MKISTPEKTFVIAGISGDIGIEFARRCEHLGKLYGISRKQDRLEDLTYEHVCGDLLIPSDVQELFKYITPLGDLTYIHLPGKFQFQDENHSIIDSNDDGIDDDTFATNVETFRNVKPYLSAYLERNTDARLKIIAFGSTSDLYDIAYWHSYTHSKNELRKEFRSMYGEPKTYGRVSSLFINVSTTDGRRLAGERPYISKQFVLKPTEILDQAFPHIISTRPEYLEISILKPNPDFSSEDYLDEKEIRERWYRDMYGGSKKPGKL